MQKGKEQRTMLPTLDMSKEGQFWDERKIVKSLMRFTSFPGLSVSLEPDPRSGDPEVKIMELDSGTHIAAHPTKAYQRPSLESIGRKLQLVEGLKAALNPSNLIESHHISVLKSDKSKDKEGDGKAHHEDSVACDRIVRKAVKERSVMQELLESSSMGINLALDHEEKNDTGSMRSLVINDSTVGLQKQSESPSMSNDMVVSEPIRLPRENSLVILARAREEELQRRLKEANSANECTEEEEEEEIFICPRDEEGLTTNDYLRATHFDYEILEASDKTMVHEVLEANDKSMVHEMLEANDKTMVHEILNANDKTMAHEMPEANDKTIVHQMLKANDKTMVCESGDELTAMKWHDTRDEKGLEMVGNYTRVPMFDKKLEANDKTTVHDLVGDGLMSMKSNDKVESNEPALMQREARIVRLAPTLLGSFNLEALQLAGMDNLYISIPSNHVDVSMAAPLHRNIIKPCDISKCSEGPDSSPRHVDPLNNLQSRLCILETTQEVHLLWGHIKCRSCLMALQIFLFIFVVFWGGVFDVQATPPPT